MSLTVKLSDSSGEWAGLERMKNTLLGTSKSSESELLRRILGLQVGSTPFPWQRSLLTKMIGKRSLEAVGSLDIPTGLGKTAIIAIWLLAKALGAVVPRRLVYVVDRRAVVDQATGEAERLRDYVAASEEMKDALQLQGPLPISTLRGQHADNREWLEDPGAPAIIVGTVDMVGSRLLFEGYGVSSGMRAYHAGLMGVDTLLVLDEAHLVPPFEALLRAIAKGRAKFGPGDANLAKVVPAFKLLSLSATGRSVDSGFTLGSADFKHPVVERRLLASKSLQLEELNPSQSLPKELAVRAWELCDAGKRKLRILVFCNDRKDAVAVQKQLLILSRSAEHKSEIWTELLVGARRVFDRKEAAARLAAKGFLAGESESLQAPAFLIATAAGEVGVDLDADHMVCDLVNWERMCQRLGRVNRRGEGNARVVVLAEVPKVSTAAARAKTVFEGQRTDDEKKDLGKYEKLCAVTNARRAPILLLRKHECQDGVHEFKPRDASPGSLLELKQEALRDPEVQAVLTAATTAAPLYPELSRALVDAWSMTSLENHTGRPKVDPWLRGWADSSAQVTLVWRTHLPLRKNTITKEYNDEKSAINGEMARFFEAAPPHLLEKLEVEPYSFKGWLEKRAKITPEERLVLTARRRAPRCFTARELVDRLKSKKGYSLSGFTIVLSKKIGGLSKEGLLENTYSEEALALDDIVGEVLPFRVRKMLGEQPEESTRATEGFVSWLARYQFVCDGGEDDGVVNTFLLVERQLNESETEEDRSSGCREQSLKAHQEFAQHKAKHLAEKVKLPSPYREVLCLAALVHDEGKAAERWQTAFQAPKLGRPFAKTKGPILQGKLDGYRHELGSYLRMLEDERFDKLPDALRDLALHLVVSHHGAARPCIETRSCEQPPSAMEAHSLEIALRFARLQQSWGPWGLAWMESLLRAADQQASRQNNEGSHDD